MATNRRQPLIWLLHNAIEINIKIISRSENAKETPSARLEIEGQAIDQRESHEFLFFANCNKMIQTSVLHEFFLNLILCLQILNLRLGGSSETLVLVMMGRQDM